MKKIKFYLPRKISLFFILTLSGTQLVASQRQAPTSTQSILTILSTTYDPKTQRLHVTCPPDAINTLERIHFEQENNRWSSSLFARLNHDKQHIEESSERPTLNTQEFLVDIDEKTGNVIFIFNAYSQPKQPDRLET